MWFGVGRARSKARRRDGGSSLLAAVRRLPLPRSVPTIVKAAPLDARNMNLSGESEQAWRAALGTFVSYGLILLVMFVLLFVVPFLVFDALGVA
jgi:hypothetical protein